MLQLDTGLGTHFTGLGDVPHTAPEAEESGFGAFCVISTPAMFGQKRRERFDGLVDRLFLNLTYEPAAKKIDWPRLIQELAA